MQYEAHDWMQFEFVTSRGIMMYPRQPTPNKIIAAVLEDKIVVHRTYNASSKTCVCFTNKEN